MVTREVLQMEQPWKSTNVSGQDRFMWADRCSKMCCAPGNVCQTLGAVSRQSLEVNDVSGLDMSLMR